MMRHAETVSIDEQSSSRPSRHVGDLPLYLAAASLTTLVTALALRLWRATLAVPFYYSGDALAVGAHFKTVLETGWYEYQPALGAPFGQHYHDFPQADNLHMAAVAAMNAFVDKWAVAINLYYLLGFPLAALTAVWFFRLLGVSRALSLVLAVLFALAPYHFQRNEGHLFLASYYPIPLAVGIVVMALRGSPLWAPKLDGRPLILAWLTGSGAMTVLAMTLVGTASSYYSVFTAILLGVAGLTALWRDRSWRRFAGTVGAGAVLVATVLANMAPDILYSRGRVPNTLVLTRNPEGAEVYGLKLAQLLLPSDRHRWAPMRELREFYNARFPLPGESPALGLVAASGLVILLIVMVSAFADRRDRSDSSGTTLRHLALLSLVALTAAEIGGFSTLIALFLTDSIRGWNRISIFIMCFSLGAVGLVADRLIRWVGNQRPVGKLFRMSVPAVLAIGLLGLGVIDQTSGGYIPDYAVVRAAFNSDSRYVQAIEERLPAEAAVYQMPYQGFPETPAVNGVLDSEPLRLYLNSTHTRWSAGGMKGRPQADWPLRLADKPINTVVPLLAIAGFSGISIDRKALGEAAKRVEAELAARLSAGPELESLDARFAFWPLAAVKAQMASGHDQVALDATREATILPPVLYMGPDFDAPVGTSDGTTLRSHTSAPQLLLDNPRRAPLTVRISFAVASPTKATGVEVHLPSKSPLPINLTERPTHVDTDLILPPGRSVVRLRLTPAARAAITDPDKARFDVIDVKLTDPVFENFIP